MATGKQYVFYGYEKVSETLTANYADQDAFWDDVQVHLSGIHGQEQD